jgi:6-phosphogluconolactonase (cycloisomerase 2 family)
MKKRLLGSALVCAALLGIGAQGAFAAHGSGVLFAQTDNLKGNAVVVYARSAQGTLTPLHSYATGGLGGQLEGSVADHLSSQGSLVYDREAKTLFAVNAGSDTVAVFGAYGEHLALRQDIDSGGSFPASIAVHGKLVYVLNAADGGSLQAYSLRDGRLSPLGEATALDLPEAAPQFVNTPGEVTFTPSGRQLIVTTKATTSSILVFRIGAHGALSAPTVNASGTPVPFGAVFDKQGHLLVVDAGGALADYTVNGDGTLTQLDSTPTEQAASCWVVYGHGYAYVSNAGSGSIGTFGSLDGGQLYEAGIDTPTDPGTVDAALAGRYLYVQTGVEGNIDEYRIESAGTPVSIGSLTVPGAAGGEGIATAG